MMLQAAWAVIQDGKVELLEPLDLPEGTKVIVTALVSESSERDYWLRASESALGKIWDNEEDDIYAGLLDS